MTAQKLCFIFCVLACSSKTLEFLELLKHKNDKISILLLTKKSAFRIWSLKMQILHGTVALWAWVCAGCVRVGGLEILYWPGCYKLFALQRSQCHSHLLCTSSHIEEFYVIKFLPFPSEFLEKETHTLPQMPLCACCGKMLTQVEAFWKCWAFATFLNALPVWTPV